jgi:hypothetical protein
VNGGHSPPRPSRRSFTNLVTLGLMATGLILGIQPQATACPLTDLDCVVDEAKKVVEEVPAIVDEVEETVEDVTSGTEEVVKDVVTGAKETVDDVVRETVEPPGAPEVRDPGVGSTVPPAGRGAPEVVRDVGGRRPVTDSGSRTEPVARRIDPLPRRALPVAAPAAEAPTETTAAADPVAQGESGSRDLAEAARQFAFPLLLSLLVAGFLFFHGRVDRRDPKLTLAPVDTDLILFN